MDRFILGLSALLRPIYRDGMGVKGDALRTVAKFYKRAGWVSGPIPERMLGERRQFHPSWELRISVEVEEYWLLASALAQAGLPVDQPARAKNRLVQVLYGPGAVHAVMQAAGEEVPPKLDAWTKIENGRRAAAAETARQQDALRLIGRFFEREGRVYAPVPAPRSARELDWVPAEKWSAHISVTPDARVLATLQGQLERASLKAAKVLVRPGRVIQPVNGRVQVLAILAAAGVDVAGL